jgi:hypothetical protein
MATTDEYYARLFGDIAEGEGLGAAAAAPGGGLVGKLKAGGKGLKSMKGIGAQLLGFMVLNKLLEARGAAKERGIQREGMRAQAEMATPENLYYQAAQPRAEEEEAQARSALLQQISGGVLGPAVPRGVRRIGGR